MKKGCVVVGITLSFLVPLFVVNAVSYPPLVYSQNETKPLPVLLIHGYKSGPGVWNQWLPELQEDGFKAKAVRFPINDPCGSSESHAKQLERIVQDFKTETGKDKINIVAHSKGGLDARVYLSNNPSSDDVSKLIMIGTPNLGSPAATATVDYASIALLYYPMLYPYLIEFYCFPALNDLVEGSEASEVKIDDNTDYYTIAGNWIPAPYFTYFDLSFHSNCPQFDWLPLERWIGDYVIYEENDDGIVPLSSATSEQFENIGVTNNCHTNLFEIDEEYEIVKEKLLE
jgi:pimeloyl-ACP methyl ester carboxylesterase